MSVTDEHKDSQEEPTQDSGLRTPQPDQPHPPVSDELRDDAAKDSEPVSDEVEDREPDSPPVQVNVEANDASVNVDNPVAPAE